MTAGTPYFSRGLNLLKLGVLAPFTLVGPLLLFLWRKDRFVCGQCGSLLGFGPPPAWPHLGLQESRLGPYAADSIAGKARAHRSRAWVLGLAAAAFAAFAAGTWPHAGWSFYGEMALAFASGGAGFALVARRARQAAHQERLRREQQRVLDLAAHHQGRLNVSQVAADLGLAFLDAERCLDSLIDGRRVELAVDERGRVTYVFPELADP